MESYQMNSPTSPSGKGPGSRSDGQDGTIRNLRTLREKLSSCKNELRAEKRRSENLEEDLREMKAHADSLGSLLDEAYKRLADAGMTDPLDFGVSREAIRLYSQIEGPAKFDDIMEAGSELECTSEETVELLRELLEEKVLRAKDRPNGEECYVATGHEPFF